MSRPAVLKPCPFCNGNAFEEVLHDGSDLCKIECEDCQAHIMDTNLLAVRRMWNKRVRIKEFLEKYQNLAKWPYAVLTVNINMIIDDLKRLYTGR